jgi:hypothetical protein
MVLEQYESDLPGDWYDWPHMSPGGWTRVTLKPSLSQISLVLSPTVSLVLR